MTRRTHLYRTSLRWTGNRGVGTENYKAYGRDFEVRQSGKPVIEGSSDPAFRGEPTRWNPEEMLVMALSACHQLWYLSICAEKGVVVLEYSDLAEGVMEEYQDGSGSFKSVVLRPNVLVSATSCLSTADNAHKEAHNMCFISRSVNFTVECRAVVRNA